MSTASPKRNPALEGRVQVERERDHTCHVHINIHGIPTSQIHKRNLYETM